MENERQPLDGARARERIRRGEWTGPTADLAPGFVQANLAIVPQEVAGDFKAFCRLNPRACPLLEALPPGECRPGEAWAREADIRTDLPRYRIYERGELRGEERDILDRFHPGLAAFLLGCSFSFDEALIQAGIPVRHLESRVNVSMYVSNIACRPAGVFSGPMVVSMRPTIAKSRATDIQCRAESSPLAAASRSNPARARASPMRASATMGRSCTIRS